MAAWQALADELMERRYGALVGYASLLTRNRHDAEELVQDALIALMEHRTAFVIAHRLSTVRRADKIVVLEKGRIAEIGRHDELLAKPNGVYAKLYARQAFGET